MRQRGYSLMLSLIVLLGVGSVWLAGIAVSTTSRSANQTLALSQARNALISYAVNYIDHYGAQGAGIGHLPCPDTDKPDNTVSDTWHRDGPNPPCAKQAVEHGWLPRHVNVRDGRYHFHARAQQRLLYAVSGKFVNNPLGRVVNPSTEGGITVGQYTDVIAVLATPPLDANPAEGGFWLNPQSMASQGGAYSLIRVVDLRKPTMQRVGGWLVGQLNNAMQHRCASADDVSKCSAAEHSLSDCDVSKKTNVLHWLAVDVAPIRCEDHEQHVLSTFTLLEEVLIQRHWFIRNEWFEFVELLFEQNCLTIADSVCRFVLLPVADDATVFKIQLQSLAEPVQP